MVLFLGTNETDGVSTIAREFASFVSTHVGSTTLLFDTDRQKPTQLAHFGIRGATDFEAVVHDGRGIDEAIYPVRNTGLHVSSLSLRPTARPFVFSGPRTDHLMNQLRYFLPHLLALSTNSPFWIGMNTGFKSYRCKVFDRFPRTNIPDEFSSWADFENFVNLLVRTRCIDNAKKIWWDIRPNPKYPTLEFRFPDICSRVDEAICIAALLVGIVGKLIKLRQSNVVWRDYRQHLITENKWRAVRYGVDGRLIDFGRRVESPLRQLVAKS